MQKEKQCNTTNMVKNPIRTNLAFALQRCMRATSTWPNFILWRTSWVFHNRNFALYWVRPLVHLAEYCQH